MNTPIRNQLYEIIEPDDGNNQLSHIYDVFMMAVIFISLVPLAFKSEIRLFTIIDKVSVAVFIFDYFLRWITADFRLKGNAVFSFVRYPFTPMALIDLVSILPSLSIIGKGFKLLRLLRMIRALRVFRAFKALRYSKNFHIIISVLQRSKKSLVAVGTMAAAYIIIAALVIFNVEPDTFGNFFDAIYWAAVSLTTVGYGDIYPITDAGRLVTMISSFVGIAIVALPAGIITAGYMNVISDGDNSEQ
jgi:voltage-gated potassium channel Kch